MVIVLISTSNDAFGWVSMVLEFLLRFIDGSILYIISMVIYFKWPYRYSWSKCKQCNSYYSTHLNQCNICGSTPESSVVKNMSDGSSALLSSTQRTYSTITVQMSSINRMRDVQVEAQDHYIPSVAKSRIRYTCCQSEVSQCHAFQILVAFSNHNADLVCYYLISGKDLHL